jgi:hypothetical protein
MKILNFSRGLTIEFGLIAVSSGLAQTPMFFTHGTGDDTVPIATARENVRHASLQLIISRTIQKSMLTHCAWN